MRRLPGLLLILGLIVFVMAVMPAGTREFFEAEDDAEAIAAIENNEGAWQLSNLLFSLGGLLSAAGLVMLARRIGQASTDPTIQMISKATSAMAILGVLIWVMLSIGRMVSSPEANVLESEAPSWYDPAWFVVYSILTLLAIIAVGYLLFRSGYPRLLGGFVFLFGILLLVSLIVSGDGVPLAYYFPTFILGIALLIWPEPKASHSGPALANQTV